MGERGELGNSNGFFILNKNIRHLEIHRKLLNSNIWTVSQSTNLSEALYVLSKLDEDIQHTDQWFQFYFYSWLPLSSTSDNESSVFSCQRDKKKAERIP